MGRHWDNLIEKGEKGTVPEQPSLEADKGNSFSGRYNGSLLTSSLGSASWQTRID